MAIVTLDQVKAHLRIEHDADDALLATYTAAAEAGALGYCRRTEVPEGAEPVFIAAVLLLVGDLYKFRETGQIGSVSSPIAMTPNVLWLIGPFRLLRV